MLIRLSVNTSAATGDGHDRMNLPIVLFGGATGRLKGGRYLKYPSERVPLSNLLVALGQKAGLEIEKLGESTGRVEL